MNKILVTRSSMPDINEYMQEIEDLFESHWLTNGHMALEMTLQAMHFEEGSEVITIPFTFASITHAIM